MNDVFYGDKTKNVRGNRATELLEHISALFTKDEVIAMFTEIKMEIEKKSYYDTTIIGDYEDEVRIDLVELDDVNEVIQQKIDKLKESTDDR